MISKKENTFFIYASPAISGVNTVKSASIRDAYMNNILQLLIY